MDAQLVILRLVHVVFGTFWVGTDIFVTLLLLPSLRSLGRDVERPVFASLMRVLPPAMMISSLATVISGAWIVGTMRGWNLTWVAANGWGWSISAAIAATILALVVGFGLMPAVTIRMEKLEASAAGGVVTAEQDVGMQQLTRRATTLARTNTVLLIVVVVAMAIARFV